MDLTVVAYATLALSVFVSAVKMGGWILHADPRAIIGAGRWALALLPAVAIAALGWLVASGRWTAAVLLTAFLLPVLVQAAPRWRVLFAAFTATRSSVGPFASDRGGSIVPHASSTARESPHPELVAEAIAVLRAYLQHHTTSPASEPPKEPARSLIEHRPDRQSNGSQANGSRMNGTRANGAQANGNQANGNQANSTQANSTQANSTQANSTWANGNGGSHMSTQEAFDVLGLKPTPSPREIKAAHRHLAQLLDPEQGGSPYLLAKIDEARDVLLGE